MKWARGGLINICISICIYGRRTSNISLSQPTVAMQLDSVNRGQSPLPSTSTGPSIFFLFRSFILYFILSFIFYFFFLSLTVSLTRSGPPPAIFFIFLLFTMNMRGPWKRGKRKVYCVEERAPSNQRRYSNNINICTWIL